MGKTVRIFCINTGKYELFPMGTSINEVYHKMCEDVLPNPIAARVNNKTVSLNYELYNPKQIEFIMSAHFYSKMLSYCRK